MRLPWFKQPPVVIIVTADDSPAAKSMAEKVGADGFILKAGNLRHRLMGALQELFGPSGVRRATGSSDLSSQNPPAGGPTRERGT